MASCMSLELRREKHCGDKSGMQKTDLKSTERVFLQQNGSKMRLKRQATPLKADSLLSDHQSATGKVRAGCFYPNSITIMFLYPLDPNSFNILKKKWKKKSGKDISIYIVERGTTSLKSRTELCPGPDSSTNTRG